MATIKLKGIDVSQWQGTIDWKKAKADGVDFAIIRCGYGRSKTNKDPKFEENYKNARAAGVKVGTYHYSYARNVEEAKAEADFCLSLLKGKTFDFPVAFDIEDKTQAGLSTNVINDIIDVFCSKIKAAGYKPAVYTMKSWLETKINATIKSKYDIWLAHWTTCTNYKGNYTVWQFSNKGQIKGITGYVDLDYCYVDYPAIINGDKKTEPTTAKKPITAPQTAQTAKGYKKGDKISMKNKPIYASSTTKTASGKKSGTFYIYDGEKINGRYRITSVKAFCGKKPVGLFVTGWVSL